MEVKEHDVPATQDASYPGALPLDVDKYRKYVDDFEITEEKKIELLQTLWWIMTAFVKRGFRVEAVSRAIPALAEMTSEPSPDELEGIAGVDQFNDAAIGKDDAHHD